MTIQLPKRVRQRLEDLKEQCEAASVTEVIRRAVAVYKLAMDAHVEGGSVIIKRKSGEIERVNLDF